MGPVSQNPHLDRSQKGSDRRPEEHLARPAPRYPRALGRGRSHIFPRVLSQRAGSPGAVGFLHRSVTLRVPEEVVKTPIAPKSGVQLFGQTRVPFWTANGRLILEQ